MALSARCAGPRGNTGWRFTGHSPDVRRLTAIWYSNAGTLLPRRTCCIAFYAWRSAPILMRYFSLRACLTHSA